MPNKKPVVKFQTLIGWRDRGDRGLRALLGGIQQHPNLGTVPEVTTSLVVRMDHEEGTREVIRIETLNTIYERE